MTTELENITVANVVDARAVACAVDMQNALNLLNENQKQLNRPELGMGIGIHTGDVVVGNIGTETRMDYTAQGHGVNLAARLCSAAGGGEVLTVKQTLECCQEGMPVVYA